MECGYRQEGLAAKDSTLCKNRDLKQKPRPKNRTGRYKNIRFTASRYSKRIIRLFVKQKTRHATVLQHQTQQQSKCVEGLKSDTLETRKPLRNLNSAGCCTCRYKHHSASTWTSILRHPSRIRSSKLFGKFCLHYGH